MDFWQQQDRARRASWRLIVVFVLSLVAVVALVYPGIALFLVYQRIGVPEGWENASIWQLMWSPTLFAWVFGVITAVVLGYTWEWVRSMAGGGSSVCLSMDATHVAADATDPHERRFFNIVNEMAIASGVPAPQVFVLRGEAAINAFAAGYSLEDAAVCATRGAIETLSRDELQAVVAHEFSHILNGDMANSLRLAGVLYGFMAIGALGSSMMRMGWDDSGGEEGHTSRGGHPFVIFAGFLLAVLGGAGTLVGSIVKAAFTRQREFLADASAVQFTRNAGALSSALRKIGGYTLGTRITGANAEQISHLMFAGHGDAWWGLLATHPPLAERIRRVDPSFPGTFPVVRPPEKLEERAQAASPRPRLPWIPHIPDLVAVSALAEAAAFAPPVADAPAAPEAGSASDLPEALRDALGTPPSALAAMYALVCARSDDPDAALRTIESVTHPRVLEEAQRLLPVARTLVPSQANALPRMAAAMLRAFTPEQAAQVRTELATLAEADQHLDLREFLLVECVSHWVDASRHTAPRTRFHSIAPLRADIDRVLGAMRLCAGAENDARAAAWKAAQRRLPSSMRSEAAAPESISYAHLRRAIERIRQATWNVRHTVFAACEDAARADGVLRDDELQLLTLLGDLLHVQAPQAEPAE